LPLRTYRRNPHFSGLKTFILSKKDNISCHSDKKKIVEKKEKNNNNKEMETESCSI